MCWKNNLLLFFILCVVSIDINAKHSISELTCEQRSNPINVDTYTPRFGWKIFSQERNFSQSAYEVIVSDDSLGVAGGKGSLWESGKINSNKSFWVVYNGKKLLPATTYYWKARIWDKSGNVSSWSVVNRFTTSLLDKKNWGKARWIALENDEKGKYLFTGIEPGYFKKIDSLKNVKYGRYKLPQFRKELDIKKNVKRAIAYVCGLGHFELFANGVKVGNSFIDPGWTKYDKHALYVALDMTNYLKKGKNAIGVMLGNGFFNIPNERYFKQCSTYGSPQLKAKIIIEFTDGSKQEVITDDKWKVSQSAITFSSIYGGEDYDANLEQKGWKTVGFDDTNWSKPVCKVNDILLNAQLSDPLTIRDTLKTMRYFKNANGKWIYDLGQNFSGIIHVRVKANNKSKIIFRPGELLDDNNSVNQKESGMPYYFAYTTIGNSQIEEWTPQFTYYGFRYVQVENAVPSGVDNSQGLPEIIMIDGLHTCNSAPEVGNFHCSNMMFNKIYNLIDWSMRSNMASILTDCPHREKLGWLEENHLMQNSLQYRYQLDRLYSKTITDMKHSQWENGVIPTVAPTYVIFNWNSDFSNSPEWGTAYIISPWNIYLWYGDIQPMKNNYSGMKKYLEYLIRQSKDYIVDFGLGDWYDIGPKKPGKSQLTSHGVTATALTYYCSCIMSKMANILNKDEDRKYFDSLSQNIRTAFNKKYWDPIKKQYDRNSQTANAMTLVLGLVSEENKKQVYTNLINDIRMRGNALTAGDIGYCYVLKALENGNNPDVVYDMNCKYDVPGYGMNLAKGATALTESWQGYTNVSNNHFMLGHLMEWLFNGLGGIRQGINSIAFKNIDIRPSVVRDIKYASTDYESFYGKIVSDWKYDNGRLKINVEIPCNTTANVYLPTSDIGNVTESGVLLADQSEIKYLSIDNQLVIEIGSGVYNFEIKDISIGK